MGSLRKALDSAHSGTGDVAAILGSLQFRPRLPGLTGIISSLSKAGQCQIALEVFTALPGLGFVLDTAIYNAAISACDRGNSWEHAQWLLDQMPAVGLQPDAISYSSVISALARGGQTLAALQVFDRMQAGNIAADVVSCTSLIDALGRGGRWQAAEQLFKAMCAAAWAPAGRAPVMSLADALSGCEAEVDECAPEVKAWIIELVDMLGDSSTEQEAESPGASSDGPSEASQASGTALQAAITFGASLDKPAVRLVCYDTTRIAPNVVCCNTLLAAFGRARPLQGRKAKALLNAMAVVGGPLAPDDMSRNLAMKARCGEKKTTAAALRAVNVENQLIEMVVKVARARQASLGEPAGRDVFRSALCKLAHAKRLGEAAGLLAAMPAGGAWPDAVLATEILAAADAADLVGLTRVVHAIGAFGLTLNTCKALAAVAESLRAGLLPRLAPLLLGSLPVDDIHAAETHWTIAGGLLCAQRVAEAMLVTYNGHSNGILRHFVPLPTAATTVRGLPLLHVDLSSCGKEAAALVLLAWGCGIAQAVRKGLSFIGLEVSIVIGLDMPENGDAKIEMLRRQTVLATMRDVFRGTALRGFGAAERGLAFPRDDFLVLAADASFDGGEVRLPGASVAGWAEQLGAVPV